jgi:hypothetical protein
MLHAPTSRVPVFRTPTHLNRCSIVGYVVAYLNIHLIKVVHDHYGLEN